ncbi:hypothetical protein HZA86_01295 [Candidatus Uhrbacteria bacterium]|nr:hypothetical protein [Candidatus Uhrbacteria bacterium]
MGQPDRLPEEELTSKTGVAPMGPPISLDDARRRRDAEIAATANEFVEDLTLTGSYLELSLDQEAYLVTLDEIAEAPENPEEGRSKEGVSEYEHDLLIAISVARMNQADASEVAKQEQRQHLDDVYQIVTAAAKMETSPVDLKGVQRRALLHDCGKLCPMMKKNQSTGAVEIVLSDDPAKKEKNIPKNNPDLWGHNAHSALEAVRALREFYPASPTVEALSVGKGILTHSDDEFPDEFALIKGRFVERRKNYDVYNVFGTLFVRSRAELQNQKSIEDNMFHAADMIVGVGTGSYSKYLEQHVNNPSIVDEDTETMNDRGWTRLQAAVQTCFETSANNFFKAPHAVTREHFGKEALAEAEAYREWFRLYTSNIESRQLNDHPHAAEIKNAINTINNGDYSTPAGRKEIPAAYVYLLSQAKEYAQATKEKLNRKAEGLFARQYCQQFVEEHSVLLDDEQQYWSNKFTVDAVPATVTPEKGEEERAMRKRKKEWKLKNIARLQQAIREEA